MSLPVKERINSSSVWQYFQKSPVPGNDNLVICALCGNGHKRSNGSTSNQLRHIKIHHPNTPPPYIPLALRVFKGRINSCMVWEYFQHSPDPGKDDIVLCAICGHEQPRLSPTPILKSHIKNHHPNTPPPHIPLSLRVYRDDNDKATSKTEIPSAALSTPVRSSKTNGSCVWEYFNKPVPGENPETRCNMCGATYKYCIKTANSTTPLWRHLQVIHFDVFCETQKRPSMTPKSILENSPNYTDVSQDESEMEDDSCNSSVKVEPAVNLLNAVVDDTEPTSSNSSSTTISKPEQILFNSFQTNTKKEFIDGLVLKIITSDLQPCSFVENKSFRHLLKVLDPYYELPSCHDISEKLLPEAYKQVQLDVKLSLQLAEKVSVTINSLVSLNSQQYVTVTANFLSPLWEQKSYVLSTAKISNDTADDLVTQLRNIFAEWGIQNKVCAVISDCSSALIVDAVSKLDLEIVPCLVRTIDRTVKEALKGSEDVSVVARKVRGIASFFQNSNECVGVLKEMQSVVDPQKMLVKDEETRWMSTLNMFRGYIEHHETISAVLCFLPQSDDCITEEEVNILKKAVETLEPFELAAEELFEEQSAFLSTGIPLLKQMQECLIDLNFENFSLTTTLLNSVEQVCANLESHFIVGASTLLDPRFKLLPFSNHEKSSKIEGFIRSKLSEMFDPPEPLEMYVESPKKPGKKSLWKGFDSRVSSLLGASPSNGPSIELRRYFESRQPRRDEVDPLVWWKTSESVFPNLTKLAKQFLAIPGISVPAKLVFSKDSEVFLAKRSCLSDDHVDKILFLNKNS